MSGGLNAEPVFLAILDPGAVGYARRVLATGSQELPLWAPVALDAVAELRRRVARGLVTFCAHLKGASEDVLWIWVMGRAILACPECRGVPDPGPGACASCETPLDAGEGHVIVGQGLLILEGRVCETCRTELPREDGSEAPA